MKTYTAILLVKLYKKVSVTVSDDMETSKVVDLLWEQAPAPLWGNDRDPDNIDNEIYDLFEEVNAW